MKEKNYKLEIEIPQGIDLKISGDKYTVKGPKGELSRNFFNPGINSEIKDNKIIFHVSVLTKRENKILFAFRAHLKNMFVGVKTPYVYKLKICSGHFPMNVTLKGDHIIVKNFLGEKKPRELDLMKGAKVTIAAPEITVESVDKEIAGQVAASIEELCKRADFDKRVFQDGIYITNKAGKDMRS